MTHGNEPDTKPRRRQGHIITLAGFMGTGKSTVGQLVAAQLSWPLVDTDAVIETRAGRTIADIFANDGEAAFRALEAAACGDAAAMCHRVIAVGGGALLDPQTLATFASRSLIVCLTCNLDTIIERVGNDPARPLFSPDIDQLKALYHARAEHYASLPHQIDTTHLTPAQVAEEILTLWQQRHQT